MPSKQQTLHVPISTYGGSNHGSPVFIWFRYPMVNSPTHSPKSLDHFLLTTKDRPSVWTKIVSITLQVGRCNVLGMGNNETTNSTYNVMTSNLSLGQSMLKLHCILCVFDHCLSHGEPKFNTWAYHNCLNVVCFINLISCS